jgi:bacterioferritin-associated ferredoxin
VKLARQRHQALRRARAVEAAFVRPDALISVARPDTTLCRCEELSFKAIRAAISAGDGSSRDVKMRTRIGMGVCQGRTCESLLHHEVIHATGRDPDPAMLLRARPPFEPVPLAHLADLKISD